MPTIREFLDCAFKGQVDAVRDALAKDRSLAMIASDGEYYEKGVSALHLASGSGHIETVNVLLKAGAPVNANSQDGSPLAQIRRVVEDEV